MALPKEVWEMARTIWENTTDISYDDLIERLVELFGDDAPTAKATICARAKKEQWKKRTNLKKSERKSEQKTKNSNENNKVELALSLDKKRTEQAIQTTEQKIDEVLEGLVLDANAKKKIILKHRRRIKHLGELQEATMQNIESLYGLDAELDADKIKATIMTNTALSAMLEKMASVQESVFKQEVLVSGIVPEDFQQSEQERRMQSLHLLEGISEQESQARANKIPELMERLAQFESMELDGCEALAD